MASPGASRAGELRGTSGAVVAAAFALGFAAGAVSGDEARASEAVAYCVWNARLV